MPPKKGAKARAARAKAKASNNAEKQEDVEPTTIDRSKAAIPKATTKAAAPPKPVFISIISTRAAARRSAGSTTTPIAVIPAATSVPEDTPQDPKKPRATEAQSRKRVEVGESILNDTATKRSTSRKHSKRATFKDTTTKAKISKSATSLSEAPDPINPTETVSERKNNDELSISRVVVATRRAAKGIVSEVAPKAKPKEKPKAKTKAKLKAKPKLASEPASEPVVEAAPETIAETTIEKTVISLAVKRPIPIEHSKPREFKKPRIDTFRFTNDDNDPIIDSLKQMPRKCTQICSIDNELLDHVALEGLTGITFGRLCLILDAVIPTLNSCKDDAAQDHIWSIINRYAQRVPGARVQTFYLDQSLPEQLSQDSPESITMRNPNGTTTTTKSKKTYYIDKAIKLPEQSLKWLGKTHWMLHPVLDGHIMGSCCRYTSRVNISEEVASYFAYHGARDSLLAVHEQYNLKNIYFVADQELRRRAILPMTCDPNMDIKLREYACLELIGRTRSYGIVFPNDKTLGRYRILLSAKGLISQFQQTCNTFIIHHIRRFTQFSLGMTVAKAFKGGRKRDQIRQDSRVNGEQVDDDDEPGGTQGEPSERDAAGNLPIKDTCCHPRRLKCDRDMLKMVYDVIASSRGRSMCDIRRKLKLPKHHVRNHLKNLANIELIGSHTRIVGDKKTRIYRARHRSSRRKRVLSQKKHLQGVRSKWDSVDVRARDLLGNRRSQFSQAEDSLLILCRIAGLLLQPNLTKLSFAVPKQVIRDILHDELYESHDKTSDSLLRRTKFLRKMPSNVMLINELTAELRDDTDIVRLIGIKHELDEESTRNTERLVKLFKQVLRAIRAKLPHLLGLTSTLAVGNTSTSHSTSSNLNSNGASSGGCPVTSMANIRAMKFSSLDDLKSQFQLIDCQDASGGGSAATFTTPPSTLVQLAEPLQGDYRLEISNCSGMRTIMLLSSCCVSSSFNLDLHLKVPVRVVGLDQDSENFKEMFEHAKESKETSRLIANLTTPNPTADSRRALFMLRNALKLQTIDKCGKLADALVVQPCDITFSSSCFVGDCGPQTTPEASETTLTSDKMRPLVRKFLDDSKFINEFLRSDKRSEEEPKGAGARKRRRTMGASTSGVILTPPGDEPQASTSSASVAVNRNRQSEEPLSAEVDSRLETLLEMIETVMSWVSAMPGIELEVLQRKMQSRLGERNTDHLNELLQLMTRLELITRDECADTREATPRLFGYQQIDPSSEESPPIITFEPGENAYVRYCQLLDMDPKAKPTTTTTTTTTN